MTGSGWDADGPALEANLAAVLTHLRQQALDREIPDAAMIAQWHAIMMHGLVIDDPDWPGSIGDAFRGGYRGSRSELEFDVWVPPNPAVPFAQVSEELDAFFAGLSNLLGQLDAAIGADGPSTDEQLIQVVNVSAWAHAEWVRIHPFINGNGRTARLIVDFLTVRYGLPIYLRIRPRPKGEYALAGAAAMRGDFLPTVRLFHALLEARLAGKDRPD
ncbi:MAG: Fic family protein [Novosphingobium sp.]|uniref:Fic family protein n=1 Tax=Novosphingobium sp. TaxID=1874826 RepID=UPI002622A6C8|nr:Fic family protein [Novosphingobium sp.]MCP5386534.1 Fic family protein [Novosphingobium sp.]